VHDDEDDYDDDGGERERACHYQPATHGEMNAQILRLRAHYRLSKSANPSRALRA
jgi:hypothetical protein